jgi:hypothetical protein
VRTSSANRRPECEPEARTKGKAKIEQRIANHACSRCWYSNHNKQNAKSQPNSSNPLLKVVFSSVQEYGARFLIQNRRFREPEARTDRCGVDSCSNLAKLTNQACRTKRKRKIHSPVSAIYEERFIARRRTHKNKRRWVTK